MVERRKEGAVAFQANDKLQVTHGGGLGSEESQVPESGEGWEGSWLQVRATNNCGWVAGYLSSC